MKWAHRSFHLPGRRRRGTRSVAISLALPLLAAFLPAARAEDAPPAPSTFHPLLDELNRETRSLYRDVRTSVVRVQLPPPQWLNAYAMAPISRWEKLDPKLRDQLQTQWKLAHAQAMAPDHPAEARTQPAPPTTQPDVQAMAGQGTILFVTPAAALDTRVRDALLGGKLQADVKEDSPAFSPNNIGVLLDEAGHVLVPLYVEREAFAHAAVRVATDDGQIVLAQYIGSDRQTNLTLLQVPKSTGKPVQLSAAKPEDGSLVLLLSPGDASGRLSLWNGGAQEFGVVFTLDGRAAGVARYGQFLSGSACRLIADQIIRFGTVKRATLGVIVSEIRKGDPLREQVPVLSTRTAMRIDEVLANTAADRAGLKAGDLLLALAGESVSDVPSLAAAIAARDGETELQVLRGNKILHVTVNLQAK